MAETKNTDTAATTATTANEAAATTTPADHGGETAVAGGHDGALRAWTLTDKKVAAEFPPEPDR